MSDGKILFKRKHETSFAKTYFQSFLNTCVSRQGAEHLAAGHKQMAIYAYDFVSHYINIYGVYEKDELDTFFDWTTSVGVDFSNATALDIGANIGNHSLYFSSRFKHVISFEPHPRTFQLLALNAQLVSNITCHNVGLSDGKKTAQLSFSHNNMGAASVHYDRKENTTTIELINLDSLPDPGNVRLIKIDAEGHESQVIDGAAHLIGKYRPFILFEQNIADFADGRSIAMERLKALGYSRFAAIPHRSHQFFGKSRLRYVVMPIYRFLFGKTLKLVMLAHFKSDFYPFIIAIPDTIRLE